MQHVPTPTPPHLPFVPQGRAGQHHRNDPCPQAGGAKPHHVDLPGQLGVDSDQRLIVSGHHDEIAHPFICVKEQKEDQRGGLQVKTLWTRSQQQPRSPAVVLTAPSVGKLWRSASSGLRFSGVAKGGQWG